jgi:hypothetical protein
MRGKQAIWVLLVVAAVTACANPSPLATITSVPYLVTFNVSHISVEPSGKTQIELAITNSGRQELPADKFVAHFELLYADGTLRAASDTMLPRVPPSSGDLTTVVSLNTPLEAGEYRAAWGVSGLGSTLVTFEIVAENGGLQSHLLSAVNYGPGYPYPASSFRP